MVSFSTTDERMNKIDSLVEHGVFADRSTGINQAIDFFFKTNEIRRTVDFMYFVSIPFLFFLITLGITLYFGNLFFYVLFAVSGMYLFIFFYLFYNKYRGVRWR